MRNQRSSSEPLRVALLLDMAWGYTRGVLRGIMDCAKPGKNWIFRMFSPDAAHAGAIAAWRADGVIVHLMNRSLAASLGKLRIPAVSTANFFDFPGIPRVGVAEQSVGRAAAEYFIERGFVHLAFAGPAGVHFSEQRRNAFAAAAKNAGLATQWFCGEPVSAACRRWLLALPKPAALFCATDNVCWGLAEICRNARIRVPEELALLGCDNDEFECELSSPALSSVANPAREIGSAAATLLDRLLRGRPAPARPLLFEPMGVITRASTDIVAIADADLSAALRWINAHAGQPLSVKQILRQVPVSRRTLELKFKAHLHRTPHEEITRVRLHRAKLLLRSTRLSVSEIARQCGFSSLIRFSTVFRNETGQKPTQFRGGGGVGR